MDADFPIGMAAAIEGHLLNDKEQVGQDCYQAVFDNGFFFPLQRQAELKWMIQQARAISPRKIVEIGADKAGGLYHWCKCLPTAVCVGAIEIRGTPYSEAFERAFRNVKFAWHSGSSRDLEAIEKMRNLGEHENSTRLPIDVLFIDGDKTKFEEDFDAYLPLMAPGGIVFMHDINDGAASGPRIAFERIKARGRYKTKEFIDNTTDLHTLKNSGKDPKTYSAHEGWLVHWNGRSCGVGMIRL